MIMPGEYSDTLRALGQFLDRMGASTIEIINRGDDWLTASTLGSETLFEVFKLQDLRAEGRLRRGLSDDETCELAETLRTVGYILDAANATDSPSARWSKAFVYRRHAKTVRSTSCSRSKIFVRSLADGTGSDSRHKRNSAPLLVRLLTDGGIATRPH